MAAPSEQTCEFPARAPILGWALPRASSGGLCQMSLVAELGASKHDRRRCPGDAGEARSLIGFVCEDVEAGQEYLHSTFSFIPDWQDSSRYAATCATSRTGSLVAVVRAPAALGADRVMTACVRQGVGGGVSESPQHL